MQLRTEDLIIIERALKYYQKYGVAHDDLIEGVETALHRIECYRNNYETDWVPK